jgi:hypothetical protein
MHNGTRGLLCAALVTGAWLATSPVAEAQLVIGIGVAPNCPYGYYDAVPYGCAPAGYYGPEWFSGGLFIGAGPWFHGDHHFHGYVDNRFHPAHGYQGGFPNPGDRVDESQRVDQAHFHGNERRDGRGHASPGHRGR